MIKLAIVAAALSVPLMTGCSFNTPRTADLALIYNTSAQNLGVDRTPVVVVPGILGSKLNDEDGSKVWGSFTFGAADVDTAVGARQLSLPMEFGKPLSVLRDSVIPSDVLDVVEVDVGLVRGIRMGAYVDIMKTLAAGNYRDESLGRSGAVDYGGLHYTCFQLPYDWRRDIAEQAAALDQVIFDAQEANREAKNLEDNAEVRVDVIAHSMGGLVLRYYMRYGTQQLPEDGSLPELNWAGAANVRQAILIGTPNAGAASALTQLVNGLDLNPILPNFRPSILGTMPAIYQLLPRERHSWIIDKETGDSINVFDIETWDKYGWGLVAESEDSKLRQLLPDIETREERLLVARDHLKKCLERAEQFHRSIDIPASPPPGTTISLFAGDAKQTPVVLSVDAKGTLRVYESGPGDGTVARYSAVHDERTGGDWKPFLRTPIDWNRVQFIFADHLGLTKDTTFIDNILFMLLETPENGFQE
jgi:pimeloyl-ACP methyl ester carboxylesterase